MCPHGAEPNRPNRLRLLELVRDPGSIADEVAPHASGQSGLEVHHATVRADRVAIRRIASATPGRSARCGNPRRAARRLESLAGAASAAGVAPAGYLAAEILLKRALAFDPLGDLGN